MLVSSHALDIWVLLEAPHGDLGVQEIDPAHEAHVREILDHIALSCLGDRMVVTIYDEFEGCVWNVFVPQMPGCSVLFVHLFVGASSGVQLVNRFDKYTSPREQLHMLLLFQGEDTERS